MLKTGLEEKVLHFLLKLKILQRGRLYVFENILYRMKAKIYKVLGFTCLVLLFMNTNFANLLDLFAVQMY